MYRVQPNLSLRGKDVQARLRNRTLVMEGNGSYSLDEAFDEVRRMNKMDRILKMREFTNQSNSLRQKLQTNG